MRADKLGRDLRAIECAEPTVVLRQLCRARKDLIARRIAVANQPRAHLCVALLAAVGLFTTIGLLIRQFLTP